MKTDFENGIEYYETDYAPVPVHWPNGKRRCLYCYDWFRTRRIDGRDYFWCALAPIIGVRTNHLANPNDRPEWCPFISQNITQEGE